MEENYKCYECGAECDGGNIRTEKAGKHEKYLCDECADTDLDLDWHYV